MYSGAPQRRYCAAGRQYAAPGETRYRHAEPSGATRGRRRDQIPACTWGDYQRIDESDLILEGYIAFLDPPKETTAPALKALKASGITVKILTGDSELVAAKVCHEVGLDAGDVVIGSDIEGLSDDALAALAARTTLFARLTPMHKERIVTLLKREGHVVGFMGDGLTMPRRCGRRILVSR